MSRSKRIEMTDLLWDIFMDKSFYSQESPGPGYTDMQELPMSMHALAFLSIILALLAMYHTLAAGSWLFFSTVG